MTDDTGATLSRGDGRTLAEALVARIRESIVDGTYAPGHKLPSESALIDRFGVSRTVVREAISRLGAAGLVETYRGRGTWVLLRPDDEPFAVAPGASTTVADRVDLLELRMGVESESAVLAAQRADAGDRALVAEALDLFRASGDHPARALDADFRFHLAVAAASHNRHIVELVRSLGPTMIAMPRIRLEAAGAHGADAHRLALREHEAIAAAIARRDPVSAGAAMRTHLANSRERLLRGPAGPSGPSGADGSA